MTDNTQQIFDTVVTHLLSMKKRSRDDKGCRYRGENGAMCAAGVLIPDEEYKENMEGNVVDNIDYFITHYDEEQLRMLTNLQNIHDERRYWVIDEGLTESAIDDLKYVASDFKLEWKYD